MMSHRGNPSGHFAYLIAVHMLQVAAKQEESFAELLLVRRVPAAYRQCLAECMRR